jgi:hypothetical protein
MRRSRSGWAISPTRKYDSTRASRLSWSAPIWSYRHLLETGRPEHNMLMRHTALASVTSITYDPETGKMLSITYADPAANVE